MAGTLLVYIVDCVNLIVPVGNAFWHKSKCARSTTFGNKYYCGKHMFLEEWQCRRLVAFLFVANERVWLKPCFGTFKPSVTHEVASRNIVLVALFDFS